MSRNCIHLIFLLAVILIVGGCGSSNPVDPSMRGESVLDSNGILSNRELPDPADIQPWNRYAGEDIRNLPRYIEGEVLIVLHDGVDPQTLYPIAKTSGLSLKEEIDLPWQTVYRMSIDNGEPVESPGGQLDVSA